MEPNKQVDEIVEEKDSGKGQPKTAKDKLYDKIPVTYRQVDIFVKIMVLITAGVLIAGIISGTRA